MKQLSVRCFVQELVKRLKRDLAERENDVQRLQKDVERMQKELDGTKKELKSHKERLKSTEEELHKTKQVLKVTNKGLQNTQDKLGRHERVTADMQNDMEKIKRQLEAITYAQCSEDKAHELSLIHI